MKNICVIGAGYVGLVSGTCFAELGNRVHCIDTDEAKVESLRSGVMPIYEPELEDMVRRNMEAGRLTVTTSYEEGMRNADFVLVAVGTPNDPKGGLNLSYLHSAYEMIAANLNGTLPIIINKSTIPPGTGDVMQAIISKSTNGRGIVPVVSNPEFLREGRAIFDFMNPTRIVIGSNDSGAIEAVVELHKPLDSPILRTDLRTAEMIKYASNAFLATKISFINEIAAICDRVNVDVTAVADGIGMDPRIGREFLNAGIGYGGSCLPKDIGGLMALASECGYEPVLLNATAEVNRQQPHILVDQVENALGSLDGAKVAVWGLTFKPNTDDIRHSSAMEIIDSLKERGAEVTACDPKACHNVSMLPCGVEYVLDPLQAAEGCDAVILATDWRQYTEIDFDRLGGLMRGRVFADGRNAIDPEQVAQAGFHYIGVGRSAPAQIKSSKIVTSPILSD